MRTLRQLALPLSFALALAGALGSLYAQALGYQPCVLCWWQRIFLYPLVLLIPLGIWKRDRALPLYVGAFALAGALVALYHALLYYGVIPEALAPCFAGVPCTQKLPSLFGLNFITASLADFILILALMFPAAQAARAE